MDFIYKSRLKITASSQWKLPTRLTVCSISTTTTGKKIQFTRLTFSRVTPPSRVFGVIGHHFKEFLILLTISWFSDQDWWKKMKTCVRGLQRVEKNLKNHNFIDLQCEKKNTKYWNRCPKTTQTREKVKALTIPLKYFWNDFVNYVQLIIFAITYCQ